MVKRTLPWLTVLPEKADATTPRLPDASTRLRVSGAQTIISDAGEPRISPPTAPRMHRRVKRTASDSEQTPR